MSNKKNDQKHRINLKKYTFVRLGKSEMTKKCKNITHTSNKDNLIGLKEFFKWDCDDCLCMITD